MTRAFLRVAVPSNYTPGYAHAAGTEVYLVQRSHMDADSAWWVEFRVPDDDLEGGAWYETLEISAADLDLPADVPVVAPPDRDELLDGARELFGWILDDRNMYGRVRVSRFETIASWVRSFDSALQLPLPRPNRWITPLPIENEGGAKRAEPEAEKDEG